MSVPTFKKDEENKVLEQLRSKDDLVDEFPNGREIGKPCPFKINDQVTLNERGLEQLELKDQLGTNHLTVVSVHPDSRYPGDYPVVLWDIKVKLADKYTTHRIKQENLKLVE